MLTRRHFLLTAAATPLATYGASHAIAGETPVDGAAGKPAIVHVLTDPRAISPKLRLETVS